MARRKKATGKPISHDNCVTKKLSEQRRNDFKALAIAKKQEKERFLSVKKRGNKIGLVLIPGSHNAYRQVEIV